MRSVTKPSHCFDFLWERFLNIHHDESWGHRAWAARRIAMPPLENYRTIDGRYTGPVTEGDFGNTNADPSSAAMGSAFGMAVNQYISGELDYHSDLTYQTMSVEVNDAWKYELDNRLLVQEKDIYTAISQNKFLKIWVLCGYYDLATPFFAAEWVFDHVFLNPEDAGRVTFSHYPSGHMIYMHGPSLASFREEALAWYNEQ